MLVASKISQGQENLAPLAAAALTLVVVELLVLFVWAVPVSSR